MVLEFLETGFELTIKILGYVLGIIESLVPTAYLNIALLAVAVLISYLIFKAIWTEVGIGYKILFVWLVFILLKLLILIKVTGG